MNPNGECTDNVNITVDFLHGLDDRNKGGYYRKNAKSKENREIYAEDALARKISYVEMRCEMPGTPRSTFLMVFSPDGTKVASTHGNHNIYVTDLKTGKNVKILIGHPRTPWCIAFHPTSNQILASGCLGGQVRIWDLSGGSEVWTTGNQSVIASIAFHPNDRILVIATYNELYFWDWSKPQPFVQVATGNPKEKVRYVAFDKLGHKLITGIANSPQARWERVRAPVPLPRQPEPLPSPFHLRITPRIVRTQELRWPGYDSRRDMTTNIPERERRLTSSYRNLLREYEQLVQRYLKVYRPPTMVDRGTDPMEPVVHSTNHNYTQTPSSSSSPQPSTSMNNCSSSLMMPSRILAMKKQMESRKHKSTTNNEAGSSTEKRVKIQQNQPSCSSHNTSNTPTPTTSSHIEVATQTQNPRKVLAFKDGKNNTNKTPTSGNQQDKKSPGVRIVCPITKRKLFNSNNTVDLAQPGTSRDSDEPIPSTSSSLSNPVTPERQNVRDLISNIRPLAEEVRNRFLPIIKSLPASDRPTLIRRFENSTQYERLRIRQLFPNIVNKKRRTVVESSSESSSSDDEDSESTPSTSHSLPQNSSSTSINDTNVSNNSNNSNNDNNATNRNEVGEEEMNREELENELNLIAQNSPNDLPNVRNFIMELEELLINILNTGLENNDEQNNTNNNNNNNNTTQSSSSATSTENQLSNFELARQEILALCGTNDGASLPSYNRTNPRRRMSSSQRLSAFMPTRVNYNRPHPRFRRNATRIYSFPITQNVDLTDYNDQNINNRNNNNNNNNNNTFAMDEVINYSERENSEGDPILLNDVLNNTTSSSTSLNTSQSNRFTNTNNDGINNIYSNIIQDLESSLNNVRNLRSGNRSGDATDVLSSFAQSLEDILNQSDTILRNLGGSIELLPNLYSQRQQQQQQQPQNEHNEPRASFNDREFYIREPSLQQQQSRYQRQDLNNVESDHNYPRSQQNSNSDNISPLLTSLHLTISYIQRQARILRQQVESIERIDRAMIEVEQLQLMRQLLLKALRHSYIQRYTPTSNTIENRNTTGMSSVRQMMAGTRITDSSYDSQSEDQSSSNSSRNHQTTTTTNTTSGIVNEHVQNRMPRTSLRKTFPPSRVLRLQRQCRRTLLQMQFRRHLPSRPERGKHPFGSGRSGMMRNSTTQQDTLRHNPFENCANLNINLLNTMARRLETLITEQTRIYAQTQNPTNTTTITTTTTATTTTTTTMTTATTTTNSSLDEPSTSSSIPSTSSFIPSTSTSTNLLSELNNNNANEFSERLLCLRLHESFMRLTRYFSNDTNFRNLRTENIIVTPDGTSRYNSRYTLSLIISCLSMHIGEFADNNNIIPNLRNQIQLVLAMSLLFCDFLLLQLVDSIPPPIGTNLEIERESLTSRIDQMCGQMIQNHFNGNSHELTRNLQHMRLTMRHAYNGLGQTYNLRRNAIMTPARRISNRSYLLNRYIRYVNRRRQATFGNLNTGNNGDTSVIIRNNNTVENSTNDNNNNNNNSSSNPNTIANNNNNNNRTPTNTTEERFSWLNTYRHLVTRYSDIAGEDDEVATNTTNNSNSITTNTNNNNTNLLPELRRMEVIVNPVLSENNISTNSEDDDSVFYMNQTRNTLYRTNNVNLHNANQEISPLLISSSVPNSSSLSTLPSSATVNQPQQQQQQQQQQSSAAPTRPWNVPSVQINNIPIHEEAAMLQSRILRNRHQRFADRYAGFSQMSVLRPRFLHPFYASISNPFDQDLDDAQREANYDCDMITNVTPNHRIQVWDISSGNIPVINNPLKNIIVSECKIHNDASVDIAKDGTILVTLLPAGGYLNVTNKLGIYSLKWETLGQCLYITNFEHNVVSVSLSPLSRHLVVGLASRRVTICPSERWTMARIFMINQKDKPGELPVVRELEQNRDIRATIYKSVNCIRWLPCSGQGLIYATNTGQLNILT